MRRRTSVRATSPTSSATYAVLDHEGGKDVERDTYVVVWRRLDGAWELSLDVNAAGPAPGSPSLPT